MRSRRTAIRQLAAGLLGATAFGFFGFAEATQVCAPPSALMARLAVHAAQFEAMRTHACCAIDGRLERLNADSKLDSVKEMQARIETDGATSNFFVIKFVEDGKDKTAEARTSARERKPDRRREIRMPFHAGEQGRYRFEQVAIDTADPSRVRIAFVPKDPAEDTIEGSAWVDTRVGTVISAGFKLSKTPMLVDYVNITVEFGIATSLGPAPSKVAMEGKGGLLFVRKHFRGSATFSEYRIVP